MNANILASEEFLVQAKYVQQSLETLRTELGRLNDRGTSFDFKNEIKNVLRSDQNENISPFMNLYQKQVGVDRCKSVEKSEKECEELLDRLIEYVELNPTLLKCKGTVMTGLKGPKPQLRSFQSKTNEVKEQIEKADDSMIEILDVDNCSDSKDNYWKEDEDNNLKIKNSFKRLPATKYPIFSGSNSGKKRCSRISNRLYEMNGNQHLTGRNQKLSLSKQKSITSIDTSKLAKTVTNILKNAKIPHYLFAREVLGKHRYTLQPLVYRPTPWPMCTDFKKKLYRKMKEWAQKPTESIKVLKRKSEKEKNVVQMIDLSKISIDTLKLVKTIRNSLKDAKINQETFATEVLGIPHSSIKNQLVHPKPWKDCCNNWKQRYHKMNEWISLPGSLESFKASISKNENEIDTIELNNQIRKVLKEAKIMQRVFAKDVLRIPPGALKRMFEKPEQWTQCSNERKNRYRKIYEWIKSPEESIMLFKTLNSKNNKDDKLDADIDTAKLVKEIKNKLKEEKILHWQFAKVVLKIPTPSFSQMLLKPTPYEKCLGQTKELYRKMHEWNKSPKESIEAMKILNYKFEGEDELDTFDLVERVNKLSARLKISKSQISLVLEMSDSIFRKSMLHPVPWHLLSDLRKDYYTKIHAWLLQNEEENESDEVLTSSKPKKYETDAINTAQVASEFVQLLKMNGISLGFVAVKLTILTSFLVQLVNKPKPYADLKDSEKNVFLWMKKWMDPGKIKTLKRDYGAYVTYYKNRYLNKKCQFK